MIKSSKILVEQCHTITITSLKQHGVFMGCGSSPTEIALSNARGQYSTSIMATLISNDAGEYVRFTYSLGSQSGQSSECTHDVQLVRTPCNFGGERLWFLCPLTIDGHRCGCRVSTLYLPKGQRYFGCRHCYELAYKSSYESKHFRPGGRLYSVTLGNKIIGINQKISRLTYNQQPTKNNRKFNLLTEQLSHLLEISNSAHHGI